MQLMGIMGQFGLIKESVAPASAAYSEAVEGEKMIKTLANVITRALSAETAEMELEDFHFQQYPLSALVQNCANNFMERAKNGRREIRIDNIIERLPYAEVDPAILSVALENLLDNALKYSFEGSYILIAAELETTEYVTIMVQDFGEQLPEEAHSNLIQPGKRWGISARARNIPGTGYGLWEASMIVSAHQGTLNFSSSEHNLSKGRQGYIVKVWMTLPLKRK
jgi:signal transduction histidine kinase